MQMPLDAVDPLVVDATLRNKVLTRHFARQRVSSDDLSKLDKLVMADAKEAALTRTAGKRNYYTMANFLRRDVQNDLEVTDTIF